MFARELTMEAVFKGRMTAHCHPRVTDPEAQAGQIASKGKV